MLRLPRGADRVISKPCGLRNFLPGEAVAHILRDADGLKKQCLQNALGLGALLGRELELHELLDGRLQVEILLSVELAVEPLAHLVAADQVGDDDEAVFIEKLSVRDALPSHPNSRTRGRKVVTLRALSDAAKNLEDARLEREDAGELLERDVRLL